VRLPRSFRVKGRRWTLRFVPLVNGEPDTLGCCYRDNRIVEIKTGLNSRHRLEIWLHEIAHAIEFEYGVKMPHGKLADHADYLERVFNANGIKLIHQPKGDLTTPAS
jgi:hypothetical protein